MADKNTQQIKSFLQLKKDLKVGTVIKTIKNFIKPEKEGEIRQIGKVQTNAIAFLRDDGRLSYLWWQGGASCIEYEGDTFKVYNPPARYNNYQKTLAFIYQIIN